MKNTKRPTLFVRVPHNVLPGWRYAPATDAEILAVANRIRSRRALDYQIKRAKEREADPVSDWENEGGSI